MSKDRRLHCAALTIAVIAVVLIGGAIILQNQAEQQRQAPQATLQAMRVTSVVAQISPTSTIASDLPGLEFYNPEGGHVQSKVDYTPFPPPGGRHSPTWQNCGIYDQPIETVNAVHSLEHGAVWVVYQPDLDAASVTLLHNLVRGKPYTLLSPQVGLSAPIVTVAWGVRLELTAASDSRLETFVKRYANNPNAPEPGAACQGGVGSPID